MAEDKKQPTITQEDTIRLIAAIDKLEFITTALVYVADSGSGVMNESSINGAYLVADDVLGTLKDISEKVVAVWRSNAHTETA